MNRYNQQWVIAVSEPLVEEFLKKHAMDSSLPLEARIVGLKGLVALAVRGNQNGEAAKLAQELFGVKIDPAKITVGLFEVW